MEAILSQLRYFNRKFPSEALEEAVYRKADITEALLLELDQMIASPKSTLENPDYMLHLYSLYLLAQFREKRAFKRIIDLVSLPAEDLEGIFGDIITENLSSILFSTFDGDLTLLKALIENRSVDIFVRGSALDVYGKLYADGVINKTEGIDYLRTLIYDHPYELDSDLATEVENVVIDRKIFEMIEDIQFLYDQNRIEITVSGNFDDFIDLIYDYNDRADRVQYIMDVIKEMYWWACFEQSPEEIRKNQIKMEKLQAKIKEEDLLFASIDKPVKIGRNDPCPCGSGKKYKKCCLNKKPAFQEDMMPISPESVKEQQKWLRRYPLTQETQNEGEVRITDHYDQASIEIDQLVYLALHRRRTPIWLSLDDLKGDETKMAYLIQAYEKFNAKCRAENIKSFDDYDRKYKIHYRSRTWMEKLQQFFQESEQGNNYQNILKRITQSIAEFA